MSQIAKLNYWNRPIVKAESTKQCPQYGATNLVKFSSRNIKTCPDCFIDIDWQLEKGQKKVL